VQLPLAAVILQDETNELEVPNLGCPQCKWFEAGLLEASDDAECKAWASEILLHRRLFHTQQDCPN